MCKIVHKGYFELETRVIIKIDTSYESQGYFHWKNKTKNVLEKTKNRNGQLAPQILNIFSQKFMDWSLGLIGKIDAKGID